MSVDHQDGLVCSFCGKSEDMVRKLVAGPGVCICDECIDICNSIIEGELNDQENKEDVLQGLPKPKEIKASLDQYVIGQEEAKKSLAVAVYNHYKRIRAEVKPHQVKDVELQKSNILMLGPTGSGKTLLAQTLARILNVPFAVADATTLTEAGYVGEDVENILLKLIEAADYDIAKAEKGIIFIDEIDKIAKKGENVSITRDVSGEGVQQALLKIIEGTVASVPPQGGRKHPNQEMLKIDTSNLLFICGGAFDGIETKIAQRMNTHVVGYNSVQNVARIDKNNLIQYVTPQDLKSFGLIPEIIGRLPVLTHLNPLDKPALERILVEPKNSIVKQYIKLMAIDGIELTFDQAALNYIVDKAVEYKLGARGLRSIVEAIMMDAMFELPSKRTKTFEVTLAYAKEQMEKSNFQKQEAQ